MAKNMNQIPGGDPPRTPTCGLSSAVGRQASDYALAQAAACGAMAALGDLYERHNRRVYALCPGMTRDSAEAEDLTQEVFIHLLRKIGEPPIHSSTGPAYETQAIAEARRSNRHSHPARGFKGRMRLPL